MKNILIQNGLLYDGLGNKPKLSDVFIENGLIYEITDAYKCNKTASRTINANGMIVCPGFVDIHRHCDSKPLIDKEFGRVELSQGITSIAVGNCGISLTPCSSDDIKTQEMYDFHQAVLGKLDLNLPRSYDDYISGLEKTLLPMNFASFIGTGSIRIAIKGFESTPFTDDELISARKIVENAMSRGALGVSLGIMYLPECYTTAEEYGVILEPVSRYGGIITVHIRGEGNSLIDSVAEAIKIAKLAKCPLEISHFKSCGLNNWHRDIHTAIKLIEDARAQGVDISCDFYPYEGGSTSLTTLLPPSFINEDLTNALKRLGTPIGINEFIELSRKEYQNWDNYAVSLGWNRVIISGVTQDKFQSLLGLSITTAAKEYGFATPEEMAAKLMHDENGKTAIIIMSMCQDDIDEVAKLPYSTVISDSIYADTDTPHPRMYGAFPKIIREYVTEREIYTMEEAIKRMTSQPAKRIGLNGRGILLPGAFADLLMFDPLTFKDNASFKNPARLATGLALCLVNGEIVVENDIWHREKKSGHLIKKRK